MITKSEITYRITNIVITKKKSKEKRKITTTENNLFF